MSSKVTPINGHTKIPDIVQNRNLSARRLPPLDVVGQKIDDRQGGDKRDDNEKDDIEKDDIEIKKCDLELNTPQCDKVPLYGSSRLALSLTCMLITTCLSLLRADMSVAIICMVKRPVNSLIVDDLLLSVNQSILASQGLIDGAINKSYLNSELLSQNITTTTMLPIEYLGEFDWSRSKQGYILSAYYYGYILTQIPGGWLSNRIGSKKVLNCGLLIGILCTLFTPIAARTSVYFVLLCRFLCGFAMGVFLPAVHSIWGKWAPPLERSLLIVLSQSGIDAGAVIAMMFSGYICQIPVDQGWTWIFYIYGIFASVVLLIFSYFGYSNPNEHPRIKEDEKLYINNSIGAHVYEKSSTPWKHILLSPAVWAIIIGHTCTNWGFYMLISCIPMYISDVFKAGSEQIGLLASLPFACTFFVSLVGCQVADLLRSRKMLSTVSVRKLFQFSGQIIPAVAVVACGFANQLNAMILLTLGMGFTGLTRSGYSCNHVDIAPKHAGLLIGLSNTVATIPGMIGPILAGAITTNGTVEEWRIVFYIIGVVYVIGAVLYCLLAKGHELNWAGCSVEPIEMKVADS